MCLPAKKRAAEKTGAESEDESKTYEDLQTTREFPRRNQTSWVEVRSAGANNLFFEIYEFSR